MSVPLSERRSTVARLTLILGSLTAFAPFATDMYLASFPAIAEHFHTTTDLVQLSLSIFVLGLASGQLLYGPLIDRYGRRKPLLGGVALFIIASLLILIAPNVESFIALRLLQAIGGCAGMVVSRAIIRDLFDERDSARVLSQLMTVLSLAPIIAPLLGGYILVVADWQAIFVFLAAFGLFCFITTARGLPETLPPERRHAQDFRQLLGNFRGLLTRREYLAPALMGGFGMSCVFVYITASPFVFMDLHGVTAQHYGWLFGGTAVGVVVGSQLNHWLLGRYAPRSIVWAAARINVLAALALLLVAGTTSLWMLMAPLWLLVATLPLLNANAAAMAMRASGAYAGSASALFGVLQFTFASVISSLLGPLHNGTAYPMAGLMLVTTLAAALVYFFGMRR